MFPSGIETLEKILRNVSNRVVLHNCPTPIGPIDSNGDDDDCDNDVNGHDDDECKETSATEHVEWCSTIVFLNDDGDGDHDCDEDGVNDGHNDDENDDCKETSATDHVEWCSIIVLHVLVVKTLTLAVYQS